MSNQNTPPSVVNPTANDKLCKNQNKNLIFTSLIWVLSIITIILFAAFFVFIFQLTDKLFNAAYLSEWKIVLLVLSFVSPICVLTLWLYLIKGVLKLAAKEQSEQLHRKEQYVQNTNSVPADEKQVQSETSYAAKEQNGNTSIVPTGTQRNTGATNNLHLTTVVQID